MCYGHGTAGSNLLGEGWDHAAGGAEHVTKANGGKLSCVRASHERLEVILRAPFGCAHHAARIDCFVGGDEDEAVDAMLDCQVSQQRGSEHIVADRLSRLVLHHRYVLVGSRVENHFRSQAIKYVPHTSGTGD